MATFGEKTEGSQNACEFTDYLVKLERARKITLFLNGDKNFFGAQMLVNKRHVRTWDAFLNASTEKTGVSSAVRFITTPVSGTKLDGLDDLRDKESYVAITRGQFKPIGYTSLSDRYKQYSTNNVHSTSSILKIRPVEHSRIQVPGKIAQIPIHSIIISVFVNGKDFDAPFRIPLSQKVLRKWDLVMKEIGDHVKGMMGGPKALYTVDGSKVITKSSDLEPGGTYVIVGNEPGGFQHYCYGCQTKAKHPKRLPPLKKKRRRTKKIVEKENSTCDIPQSAGVEAISGGDQEAQQDDKGLVPIATSQGDLPLGTVLEQPESSVEKSTLAIQSSRSITPKARSPVERTASVKIEKVSSSTMKVAEKTRSAPFNSAEEQLNDESPTLTMDKVEDSQVTEKLTGVEEQSYLLQATEMEEETEPEMEAEHDVEVADKLWENKVEKEILEDENEMQEEYVNEQEATPFEQEVASSSEAGLVSDMQQHSKIDEETQKYNGDSESSAVLHNDAKDISAPNGETTTQSLETTGVRSDERLDPDAGYPKQANTHVPSAEAIEEPLTDDKDEPVADGNTGESVDDGKALSRTNTDVEEEQKDRSDRDSTPTAMDVKVSNASERMETTETNPDVEEEQKDRSERDSTPATTDAKISNASERIEGISSDVLVHAGSSKTSTSVSKSEAPLARGPSDLHATQKSPSKTNIQPHR